MRNGTEFARVVADRAAQDLAGHEHRSAHRRGIIADRRRDDEHQPEMDRIDVVFRDQRQKDRCQHDDEHRAFHEAAGQKDEQDDQHHDQIGIVGDAEHPVRNDFGNPLEHDAVAEDARQREQEHDAADVDQAAFQGLAEARKSEHAVDEQADDDGVDHRERPDLRRREDAEAKPEQQDDRKQDRPYAAPERQRDLPCGRAGVALRCIAAAPRRDGDRDRQRRPQHQPRDDAGGEQAADRDLAHGSIQDEADAGRNDRRHQRAVGDHPGRIALGEPALEHLQAEDAGVHGRIGDGGAGDAAHQGRQRDRRLGKPPLHPPGQYGREPEQVVGDTGIVEEVAGEDEQRHREQREILRLGDRELDRNGRRQLRVLEKEQRAGNADREGDRHADQQQHGESGENDQHRRPRAMLTGRRRLGCPRAPHATRTAPSTSW